MFSAWLIASAITVLLLLWWLAKGNVGTKNHPATLRSVDVAAFRNLLSLEEERFLRMSLRPAHYRRVRRARVRAIQEYLSWIAGNCAVILALLQSGVTQAEYESLDEAAILGRRALQLRLISLGMYTALWLEYLVPDVPIRPLYVVRRYEEFLSRAERCLTPRQPVF